MGRVNKTDPVIAAEQAALGSMLLSPKAVDEVFAVVAPRDFYRPGHQLIAECIAGMRAAGKQVDPVTVVNEMTERGTIDKAGSAPYVHTLMESAMTPANAGYYAGIIRDNADRRQLGEAAKRVEQDVQAGISPADILARAQKTFDAISRGPDRAAAERTTLRGIPRYPAAAICGPLADLVSSITLPAALVGGAGLGALAGICGNADLVMPDGSLVRPFLWVPLLAPRGAGKTPSMDKAFGKLRELDAAAHDQYQTEQSEYLKIPAKDRHAADAPRDTTRRIDDATLEVVARFLENGDGTGVVESDELSGWLQSIGQYKRISGDKGRWLAMWSASPWRFTRVGADRSGSVGIDLYIQRPVVSIIGGIQPHLHNLLGDADSGFRPRWLIHSAPLETVTWGSRIHPAAEWEAAVEKLYFMREGRQWELTGEALRTWEQQSAAWKTQARGSENAATSAALDKSDIQSARIALVIAESMNPGAGGPIPADAMRCAIAIVEFVMDCWRALPGEEAFALSRKDEILAHKVDALASWLETRTDRKATRTQIKEAHVGGVRTAGEVETLLKAYAEVHPGTIVTEKPNGGGRPGQVVYAPRRGSLSATARIPSPASGVSDRSETQGMGAGTTPDATSQFRDLRSVSGHVVGNSAVGNPVVGNSATQSAENPARCAVCHEPLNPALAAAGDTTHPACDPGHLAGPR